jgi:hypothetical protein
VALFFLSSKEKARLKEAENARRNRAEIIKAWSQGQITRRELVKWGLITAGGLWVPIHGLSPFAKSAFGTIPTGTSPSPLFGVQPFSQPMAALRCPDAAQEPLYVPSSRPDGAGQHYPAASEPRARGGEAG